MRGKHARKFRWLNAAIRYGVILAVSGSIGAGVVLAMGDGIALVQRVATVINHALAPA